MSDSFRDAVAERAWAMSDADSLLSDKKDFFMAGFICGWSACDETSAQKKEHSDKILIDRLESIFTAVQEAGKVRRQSGEEVPHLALSRGMPAGLAFEQSTAGIPPLPSPVRDASHEGLGQRLEGLSLEARQIQSGSLWLDRVLCSLKRAFR